AHDPFNMRPTRKGQFMQLHQALPIRKIFIASLALVFLSGPDAVAQNQISEGTVATVDGIAITYNDVSLVEDELMAVYGQLPEEQRFQTLVGYMVNRILASEAAKKAGLENDADVAKIKAFMERKALQDVFIAKMLMERVREEDVTAYYDKEIKNGPIEEEVRARHILLDNREAADAVVADLENGADFAALAKERSKGPSGPSGGDLGYFSKQSMVPAFSDAAFKLAAGETSPPVQTQFGWHVIRVEDRRNRPVPPLDQVRDQIYQLLISEAQRDIYDEMRTKASVDLVDMPGVSE
ncbi:MAG: peptidylprolyl isomerase, partial [Pseudomonadota bacterium]|nr:peptidylprolyl isomerase [Pseudomonadota bacterium]